MVVAVFVLLTVFAGAANLTIGTVVFNRLFPGDPYGRTFLERREDGYYLGLRDCDRSEIHLVEVSPYDDNSASTLPPPPIWTTSTTRDEVRTVKLFEEFAPSSCSRRARVSRPTRSGRPTRSRRTPLSPTRAPPTHT